MANEKILNTRIITKHADLDKWLGQGDYASAGASSLVLKEGEVVLAKVNVPQPDGTVAPTFVAKVGNNNTFANSPWLFAKASDVYEWAKKASLDVADIPALPIDKITGLQSALDAKANDADFQAYKGATDTTLSDLQTAIDNVNTDLAGYATTEALGAVEDKADANTEAIAAINNETTGILAVAKKHADDAVAGEASRATGVETALEGRIATAEGQLTTIQGNDTTEGSIAKALKDAKAYAEAQDAALHTTISNEIDTDVEAVRSNLQGQIDQKVAKSDYDAKIGVLETADSNQVARIAELEAKVTNVSNVMDFIGARTVTVDEETKVITVTPNGDETFKKGDVVVNADGKEYVYDGSEWHEFGYADGNTAAIEGLNTRVTTLEGNLEGAGKVTDYVTNAVSAEAGLREAADNEIKQSVTDLTSTVTDNKKAHDDYVTANDAAVGAIAGRVTTAEGDIDKVEGDLSALAGRVETLESKPFDTYATKTELQGEVDRATGAESALASRLDALEDIDHRAYALKTDLDAVETRVDTAESDIDALTGRVDTVETTFVKVGSDNQMYVGEEVIIFDCGGAE